MIKTLLGNQVLIKPIDNPKFLKNSSGLELKSKEEPQGEVIFCGPGKFQNGVIIPMTVKVGDTVMYNPMADIQIDGIDYHLVSEDSIIAIM